MRDVQDFNTIYWVSVQSEPETNERRLSRPLNVDVSAREYLAPGEVRALISAAGSIGRHRHRDGTLILMGYRHGLRVSPLVAICWDQIELKVDRLHVMAPNGR